LADQTIYFMSEKSNGGNWKWILLVVVLAAGAGGYFYFRHGSGEQLAFNTVPVTRGELTATVTATGILNPVVNVTQPGVRPHQQAERGLQFAGDQGPGAGGD
jgi:multidrug efflux pump subunit AcrA (membrane-fusion protein)